MQPSPYPRPVVSSHQPSLWPWVGYWAKVAASDVHIMTCGVQFDYGGYQNRVQLGAAWLTLPVERSAKAGMVQDARYHPEAIPRLRQTVLEALAGKRWPGAEQIRFIVARTFDDPPIGNFLLDLNIQGFKAVSQVLGLTHVKTFLDTQVPDGSFSKTERLVARIQRHVPEERISYLAGSGARGYLDRATWPSGWSLRFQNAKEGVAPDTVLSVIARRPDDALSVVLGAFGYQPWSARDEAHSGDLAALG
ncbi:WbqC family protein [Roseococcus pinisoli]|uniref:WbqC family protein n=1 Tax=Roseococcus pinisoli TaxID=2835040 RepID=A0ABS5QFN2_9PROT|nr:WbqC family protein [Roseococcus pinisoli]MBS7812379.1 WbqC family protein [Roseococcus pinisoli]